MLPSNVQFTGINPNLIGGLTAVGLPVGYVIKKHMDWKDTAQGKKRMLTHHLVFWASVGAGLALAHKTFFARVSNIEKGIRYIAGGLIGAQGFSSGNWISHKLFPHIPKESPQNSPYSQSPPRYIPTYLKEINYFG